MNTWQAFEAIEYEKLAETRMQAHQAIQNVAAVGRCLSDSSDGDDFATLEWIPELQRLAGQWIQGNVIFRSSLDFSDFSVHLVNRALKSISSTALNDQKQGKVMVWLEDQLSALGFKSPDINLNLPYEIPEYPQAKKKAFNIDLKYLRELGKYYHNTSLVLNQLRSEISQLSAIKTWPHHFDIASLAVIKDTGTPETSASINVGMSPGDDEFGEPYFYLNPWPYPDEDELLDLEVGVWHVENWIGAVLKSSDLVDKTPEEQHVTLLKFYKDAWPIALSTIK
jgi:hypothetical protein